MVIIVGSPWQAVIAISFIENKRIPMDSINFMVEKSSNPSFEQILKILGVEDESLNNIFIFDWSHFVPLKLSQISQIRSSIKKLKVQLLEHKELQSSKEIIVFSESNLLFHLIYSLFGKNKMYSKFDDGVLDYLEELNRDSIFKKITKKLFLLNYSHLYSKMNDYSIFKRVVMFKKKQNVDISKYVDLIFLKRNIKTVLLRTYSSSDIINPKESVLLLTQSLSEDKVLGFKYELEIYSNIIAGFSEKGIKTVVKAHPRSSLQKVAHLKSLCKKYDAIYFEELGIPAEVLLLKNNYKYVIGMYSNTIIYSNELFDVKSITAINQNLINLAKGKNKLKLHYIKNQLKKYFDVETIIGN